MRTIRVIGRLARFIPLLLLGAATGPVTACRGDATSPGSLCCKICTTGKACGDTCISKSDTCHISGGCACNG
jgi:hypothetical protein